MRNIFLLLALISVLSVDAQQIFQASASYVPAGTPVSVRLEQSLSSEFTQVGETFTATLSGPIYAGSNLLAPPGSQVQGQIVAVEPAGRTGKPGYMDMRLISIVTPSGQRIPLSATIERNSFKLQADGGTATHLVKGTAIGAGAGALTGLIGASISGGKKGKAAAIGTGIGGGAGLLTGAFTKGKEFVLTSGTILPFRLDQAIPVGAPAASAPVQQYGGGDFADPGYGSYQPNYQQPLQSQPYIPQAPSNPYLPSPGYQPLPQQANPYGIPQPTAPTNPYLYD